MLMPNPASELITITSVRELRSVRWISMDGRTIERRSINGTPVIMDVSHLAGGVYVIEAMDVHGRTLREQFVKQ